jgi:hypothetical protein
MVAPARRVLRVTVTIAISRAAGDFHVLFVSYATASTGDADPRRYQEAALNVLHGLFATVVSSEDILHALTPNG